MVTLKLPPEFQKLLDQMSSETGLSPEHIAFDALADRLEDFEDLKIVEERMRNPEGPSIPIEEVMRELGMSLDRQDQKKPAAE